MSIWRLLLLLIIMSPVLSCNSREMDGISSPIEMQQPSSTSTENPEKSLAFTEQAKANALKTAGASTRAAQPTFSPQLTPTPTSEYLATLTPIPNSTPAKVGAFFTVSADVLGPKYQIKSACYFDTQSGLERYEIYTGAIAGSGDEYTSQGVAIVRKFQAKEQDRKTHVELVGTQELLTSQTTGPLLLDEWGNCNDEWIYMRTPLNFGWILDPVNGTFISDKYSVPVARLEIDGKVQLGYLGSYCWNRSCADGGAIGTSSTPLATYSPLKAHLILPIQEQPDGVSLSAMYLSPPGSLEGNSTYDYLGEDKASWSYELPGREVIDLGTLTLNNEQDIILSLEPGYYVWIVLAYWQDFGDVKYGFLIEVRE